MTIPAVEIEITTALRGPTGDSAADAVYALAVPVTLEHAATVTPDLSEGLNFEWTIESDATLDNLANAEPGYSGTIRVTQDEDGDHAIAYGSDWRFVGGSGAGGALSNAPGAIDLISYLVGSDGLILATMSGPFAP